MDWLVGSGKLPGTSIGLISDSGCFCFRVSAHHSDCPCFTPRKTGAANTIGRNTNLQKKREVKNSISRISSRQLCRTIKILLWPRFSTTRTKCATGNGGRRTVTASPNPAVTNRRGTQILLDPLAINVLYNDTSSLAQRRWQPGDRPTQRFETLAGILSCSGSQNEYLSGRTPAATTGTGCFACPEQI